MKFHALAFIAALGLPALASADDKTSTTNKSTDKTTEKTDKLTADEVKIVAHLHHVNQLEIDVGKIAQKNATAQVKSYGDTLEKDHKSADADLTTFARKHGLKTIPAEKPDTDAEKQEQKDTTAAVARLRSLKGAEFDKEFLSMMVTDHDKEVARIDASLGTTSDQDFQALLKSVRPILQRHADEARDLQKKPPASASAD